MVENNNKNPKEKEKEKGDELFVGGNPHPKQPEPEAEKILEDNKDLGYRLRATVMPPPKRDKQGNILDLRNQINKPRGKVGLITDPKRLAYLKSINPNDERVIRSEAIMRKLQAQGKLNTNRVLTFAEREEKKRMAQQEQDKSVRKQKELQKKIRFGLQKLEYKCPKEFEDDPDLNDELRWSKKINDQKAKDQKELQEQVDKRKEERAAAAKQQQQQQEQQKTKNDAAAAAAAAQPQGQQPKGPEQGEGKGK